MVDDDKAKKNGDGDGKKQDKKKEPAVNDVDKKKMNKPKVDKQQPKEEKAKIKKGKKKDKDKKKKKKRGDKKDKDKKNKKKEKKDEGKDQAEAEEEDDDEELEKDEKVEEPKKKPVKKDAKSNKDEKRAKQNDSEEDEQVLSTGSTVSGGAKRETDSSSSDDSDELTDDLDRDVEEQDNRIYAASVQIEDFIKHEPDKVESSVSVPLVQNLTVAPTALPKCDSPQKVDSGPNIASHLRVTYSRNSKGEKTSNMNDGSGKLASGSTTSKSVESTVPVTQGKPNLPEAKASEAVLKSKSEPPNEDVNSKDNPSTQVSKQKE